MQTKIKHLHPTLKACKCGFIGTRVMFYNHMNNESDILRRNRAADPTVLYTLHGEVPLNEDDSRLAI